MIRPATGAAGSPEKVAQLRSGFLAQGDKVDRVAPSGRFVCASRRHYLTDHARQHGYGVLPADQVEALASFVDEVERVTAVRGDAVRRRREQEAGERGRRGT